MILLRHAVDLLGIPVSSLQRSFVAYESTENGSCKNSSLFTVILANN